MNLHGKRILITGGTGSFGRAFVDIALRELDPRRLIVFSRDELKQFEMSHTYSEEPMRYFIGDVRDRDRLRRAFRDVDVVIHAAAMKQVPACEYNPIEAVMTNVGGAQNVIEAAIDCGVKRVVALSTDKAVNPVNLYGATKLCAEKLFTQSNSYVGSEETRFSCARYGNVIGSRGSVVPVFLRQRETGRITVTDRRMTRFWLTVEQGVRFVISCIEQMSGGEVFVPKISSMRIMDLAEAVAPGCDVELIGIRPGEKLHEVLLSEDEARQACEVEDRYVIQPLRPWWSGGNWTHGKKLPEGFLYSSDENSQWLQSAEILAMIGEENAG